jgi:hypothetical protein
MASYSNSSYTNDFFNLSGIYFNSSTGITTGLAPIESNSSLYLLKSGGTISSNLLINGSLDVKSTFTLETIGNVATKINEKQDLINDGDLTISKILNLTTILAGKQDVTTNNTSSSDGPTLEPSSTTFNEIISSSIINNNKNIEDRDHFLYTNTGLVYNRGSGQALVWGTAIRGSSIFEGTSFKPKYTGLYTISISVFCGNTALGDESLRLGLQVNYSNYNLNNATAYIVSCDAILNKDVNILHGTMVVNAVENQHIRVAVRSGNCRYVGSLSYFHGYYIGSS